MENPFEPHAYRRYFTDLKIFYERKRLRYYTGIVLSLFTVAFFVFFAIRPTFIAIATLSKDIESSREIAQKLEDKINALNLAQTKYQQVEKDLYLVEEALPQNADSPLFIRQIEYLGQRNGIPIESFQIGRVILKGEQLSISPGYSSPAVVSTIPGLDFSFRTTNTYNQLKSFFDDLNRLRRLIITNNFSFQAGSAEKSGQINLNLNAKACYLNLTPVKPEEGPKNEEAPIQ